MNYISVFLATVALVLSIVTMLVYGQTLNRHSKNIRVAEIVLCGLHQYEDGSLVFETRDAVRYQCILAAKP